MPRRLPERHAHDLGDRTNQVRRALPCEQIASISGGGGLRAHREDR